MKKSGSQFQDHVPVQSLAASPSFRGAMRGSFRVRLRSAKLPSNLRLPAKTSADMSSSSKFIASSHQHYTTCKMASFRRSTLQLSSVRLLSETTTFVCRSCRSRIASTQTRQLHASSSSKAERQRSEYFSETDSGQGQRSPFEPGLGEEDGVDELSGGSRKQRKRQKGDPGYTPAKTADGLERIGTKQWVESMRDPKDRFQGYVHYDLDTGFGH